MRALEEIRGAESLLETGKQQISGRLRVAMPVLFGRQCVAPLLIELAQEHPGLELEMSFSDRVVDLVEEGFDMAVRNGTLQDSSVLVARRLGEHRMVLCAAPEYLQKAVSQTPLLIYPTILPLTICEQAECYPGS